jgi:hypothetical protein
MSPSAILALIEGIATAVPSLIALFKTASAGGTVTQAEIDAALSGYAAARAALVAQIAADTPPQAS